MLIHGCTMLALGLALCIVIAGFLPLFLLETERVWVILTPAMAVAAGYEIERHRQSEGHHSVMTVVLVGLLLMYSQTMLFQFWI